MNKQLTSSLYIASLLLISPQGVYAACNLQSGSSANISVSVEQPLSIGKVAALTPGETASIRIGADGTRSIPANVMIGNKNSSNFGDSYQSARLSLTGSPDCQFKINVRMTPGIVSNVNLQGVNGTLLSSTFSGATGTFSSTGTATVQLGATINLDHNIQGQISESITVAVESFEQF